MATANKNLSDYDFNLIPNAKAMRFGIVVSEWNSEITLKLLQGARETLLKHGAREENLLVHFVPGSFELPLACQMLIENCKIDAAIAIGSVIQGETKHFDFVCQAVSQGIKDVNLKFGKPVIFCVLTDNTKQQSLDRAGGKYGNKGIEAAVSAIKMTHLKSEIKVLNRKPVAIRK